MPWLIQNLRTFGSVGEGERVGGERMREEGGVEVELHAGLLRPLHPRLELLGADLVAVDHLALVDAVAGVEVDAVLAGDEAEREGEVLHQLRGRTRLAGVVAGRLDAAGGAAGRLEPAYVVALPAVEGDGDLAEIGDHLLGVDADLRVL